MPNELPELNRFLKAWGRKIINKAKGNAPKATGKLANSLKVEAIEEEGNYTVRFSMLYYGDFQDKGVSGLGGKLKSGKFEGTHSGVIRYTNEYGESKISPYSFKKPVSRKRFDKWSIVKGIAPRTAKGRFMKRKSLTHAIANVVSIKGLQSSSWFSEALEKGLRKLPTEFAMKFELSLIQMINRVDKV